MCSFISECVGDGGRGVDEGHDAHTVVNQRHVGDNNIHDGLREGEEEDKEEDEGCEDVYE